MADEKARLNTTIVYEQLKFQILLKVLLSFGNGVILKIL